LIDFHCHLDLFDDPERVAAQSDKAAIYVLSVTTTPKAWRKTNALSNDRRHIRTALGLHPQLAHERSKELTLFDSLLDETRYVGEVGLDGSEEYRSHADVQMRVFDHVLATSRDRGGRIFTIHSRRAAAPVLSALRRHECASTAVLHWFSGTQRELDEATRLGCWFSVGPAMLRSAKGRQLVSRMPRDRVLTETDGPFAHEGKRPLNPADVIIAVKQLAVLWSVSADEVDHQLSCNLRELVSRVPELRTEG
jgi:TatD DNase family protein